MRTLLLVLAALLPLSACGPIYETQYNMVAPPTEMGRMCANNCMMMRQTCQQSCESQSSQCEMIANLQAREDYRDYVREREAAGKLIKKKRSDFIHTSQCDADDCHARCESDYRVCYMNCGGQVIPVTRCTAFCEQQ